jgi:hypothetical protein
LVEDSEETGFVLVLKVVLDVNEQYQVIKLCCATCGGNRLNITINQNHYAHMHYALPEHEPEVCQPIIIHPIQNSNITCYFTRAQNMISHSNRRLEIEEDEVKVRYQDKFHICSEHSHTITKN